VRIVFVDNLLLESKNGIYQFDLQPHLGLISLIAVAKSGGHEGILYDPKLGVVSGELPLDASLYQRIASEILRREPEAVGLTTLGCNFICTVKIATYLKRAQPELPILLGGPHATILDRQILESFPQFDVIARNEAELTLLPLLDALPRRLFDPIPGITFRRGDEIVVNEGTPLIDDLDALPWAAYHSYPIQALKLTSLRVEAGRGCPFRCTFCSTASFFGRRYRLKSAERLCAELDHLHAQYGIAHFSLTHDLFTVSKVKVAEFCEAVQGRGYTWSCSARMDCVDARLLERMYAAGCRSIYYGIETGSRRMQKIVDKGLDLALFTPILDATQRVGMSATASFITGYPEEEQADQDDTLDMIGAGFHRYPTGLTIQLHLLTPEPGTRLMTEFANTLAYDGHISDFNFPTLEPDDANIMLEHPKVFMNHHYYLAKLPRQQHIFVTSMHTALYKLGFPLLAHLLRYYDGRYSHLILAMYNWAKRTAAQPPFNEKFLYAFMEGKWGRAHYLTSLVRYMVTAAGLSARLTSNPPALFPVGTVDGSGAAPLLDQPGLQYQLNSGATLLRDIHNCPEILKVLTDAPSPGVVEIADTLWAERGHYLLLQERSEDPVLRNFALSEASAHLLEYFAVARSYQEYLQYFHTMSDASESSQSLFDELIALGVLQPVNARQSGLETNCPRVNRANYSIAPVRGEALAIHTQRECATFPDQVVANFGR